MVQGNGIAAVSGSAADGARTRAIPGGVFKANSKRLSTPPGRESSFSIPPPVCCRVQELRSANKFPSSQRRGGCAVKYEVAKPPYSAQTGWSVRRNLASRRTDHPVRSFQMSLRDILLMSRPPLLCEEGNLPSVTGSQRQWSRFWQHPSSGSGYAGPLARTSGVLPNQRRIVFIVI